MNLKAHAVSGSIKGLCLLCVLVSSSAVAQQRYSVNLLGYVDLNLVAGSNLVANPFTAKDNSVSNLFRGLPDGSFFLRWNRPLSDFDPTNWFTPANGWSHPAMRLYGSEAGFLWVPSETRLSFHGEVWQSTLSGQCEQHLPGSTVLGIMPAVGCNIFCADVIGPCPGDQVPDGTEMLKWNQLNQSYDSFLFIDGFGWWPETPSLDPGEAARFSVPGPFYVRATPDLGTPAGPVRLHSWQRGAAGLTSQFTTSNGCSFNILSSHRLDSGRWELVRQESVSPTGGVASISLPIGTNQTVFYRLMPPFSATNAAFMNSVRESNRFHCEFFAPVAATYELQRIRSFQPSPVWETVASSNVGASTLMMITDNNALASLGYYRLRY